MELLQCPVDANYGKCGQEDKVHKWILFSQVSSITPMLMSKAWPSSISHTDIQEV